MHLCILSASGVLSCKSPRSFVAVYRLQSSREVSAEFSINLFLVCLLMKSVQNNSDQQAPALLLYTVCQKVLTYPYLTPIYNINMKRSTNVLLRIPYCIIFYDFGQLIFAELLQYLQCYSQYALAYPCLDPQPSL